MGDDALAAELAGVAEHGRAICFDVLAQLNPAGAGREEIGKPCLALLER